MLPFVHSGMEKVLPHGGSIPQAGQHVHVLVGEPIYFHDLQARSEVLLLITFFILNANTCNNIIIKKPSPQRVNLCFSTSSLSSKDGKCILAFKTYPV